MTKTIENLVYISGIIGRNLSYAQGGGGNTSVKLDKTRMAIKASGIALSQVALDKGYSVVNYPEICAYLSSPDEDENLFVKSIKSQVIETNNIPSIETGFHALLKKYVVHTHSVYVNILACSQEGEAIASNLFENSMWISCSSPGRELTVLIYNAIKTQNEIPEIIFLQNHGLIVTADDADEVLKKHEQVNNRIKNYLKFINDYNEYKNQKEISKHIDFIQNNVLFPDQIVYAENNELIKTSVAEEAINAYWFILHNIEMNSLTPCFISKSKVDIIKHMESEKYRQNLAKNDLYKPSN